MVVAEPAGDLLGRATTAETSGAPEADMVASGPRAGARDSGNSTDVGVGETGTADGARLGYRNVTVVQLLSHMAGLPALTDDKELAPYYEAIKGLTEVKAQRAASDDTEMQKERDAIAKLEARLTKMKQALADKQKDTSVWCQFQCRRSQGTCTSAKK